MTESQRDLIRQHQQAILDFKCWSSLKWWSAVFQILPSSDQMDNKLAQSALFVQVAMKDLPQTPWYAPYFIADTVTILVPNLH